jgi:hypothetical protein
VWSATAGGIAQATSGGVEAWLLGSTGRAVIPFACRENATWLMFERFSERGRQVVVLAQQEARALGHDYIGTEHLLLGLLREQEGLAARILGSLDITVERVRAQVARIVESGGEVTSGLIPFTPRAKRVLELAQREALSLGHNLIGTEHVLLGLVRESEGLAARILLDFDADSVQIRDEVILGVGAGPTESSGFRGSALEPPTVRPGQQTLAVPSDVVLGWRRRPIALAALGAAVLARSAFDQSNTGCLRALEMQVLVHLALGPRDATLAVTGELFESLLVALACDRNALHHAVLILAKLQLVSRKEEQDGEPLRQSAARGPQAETLQ